MKRPFEPGDLVTTSNGQMGMVISVKALAEVKARFKEGRRPGRSFAPGCCQNPDYVTQIPVFFEDGTFDVMRAMNIKKSSVFPEENRRKIQEMMQLPE
jgi:hypothetical protein